jgi:hypothetical protein
LLKKSRTKCWRRPKKFPGNGFRCIFAVLKILPAMPILTRLAPWAKVWPPGKKSGRWTFGQFLTFLAIVNMRSVHAR